MDPSSGGVTVSEVEAIIKLTGSVAERVTVPWANVEANPKGSIVATDVSDEFQVAVAVKSWVVPSVNVPVAVNGCVLPCATEGSTGAIATASMTGAVTVKTLDPLIAPDVAVIVVVP